MWRHAVIRSVNLPRARLRYGPPRGDGPAPRPTCRDPAVPHGGPAAHRTRSHPVAYTAQNPELSDKSKVVAGLLQIFLGGFGIGRFYTGHVGMGVAQLLTCGGLGVWALIDGILFLVSDTRTDAQGRTLRA
ncbi:TM2 domain-containing protein [Kitasatospora arboriphila]|uniref:TM2 domain-containing protein n=1 Tax=Kitasatospora arboriphila TaxID=258052 RepID=UPI00363A75AC